MKAMKQFVEWRDKNITHDQKVWLSVILVLGAGYLFGYGVGAQAQYTISAAFIEIHANTDHIITIPGHGTYQVMPLNYTMTVISGNLTLPEGGK